jgi:quercetin dioxygenase-like cupin family protein
MEATMGATVRDATMRGSRRHRRIALVIAAAGLGSVAAVGPYAVAVSSAADTIGTSKGEQVATIFAKPLANVPGKTLTAQTVDYAPGGVSAPHHHAKEAEVFAYVVDGAVRSKVNDEPERVYKAGQFWYEPPGATHPVSANASTTEPARLLAVIVADDGVELTIVDH